MILEVYKQIIAKKILFMMFSIVLFILSVIIGVSVGAVRIPPSLVLKTLLGDSSSGLNSLYTIIIWKVRLPRILMASMVGASLAVAGCMVQGVFRNPLASPYVLGMSSGAAFGAALAVILEIWTIIPIPIFAFVFALLSLTITYVVAAEDGHLPVTSLLLAGIAVSSLFSALTSFMMYVAGEKLDVIVFWLMGNLTGIRWQEVRIVAIGSLPLIAISLFFGQELNVMMLGEDTAKSMGVEVDKSRRIIVILVALLVSVCVSYVGPVGFVGLVIPHMVRLVIGPDNRFLIPASAFFGGAFLVLADLISRVAIKPAEIPIGIITSLFGVPFFIYLLKKRKRVIAHATESM